MNFMMAMGVLLILTSAKVGRAQHAAVNTHQVHSSESGHPRIDKVKQGRHYYADCHLEVEASEVPIFNGFPRSQEWNRIIVLRQQQAISSHCFRQSENGVEYDGDPSCSNCSDTLDYMSSHFEVMTLNDSVVSIQCIHFWHPHGGNAWWQEIDFFNIDVLTGDSLEMPFSMNDVDVAQADAHISESFNHPGCYDPSGHYEAYHCHSCQSPDYLQRAQEDGRVGLVDGVWTAFETIWPSQCCHAAKSTVAIPLERFLK